MAQSPKRNPNQARRDHGLESLINIYLQWLADRRYSPETIYDRKLYLRDFRLWCADRGVRRTDLLTRSLIDLYQAHLANRPKADGGLLAAQTQRGHLGCLSGFCSWLTKSRRISVNPAAELVLPRQPGRIPRDVLSAGEVERILDFPDVTTCIGLRDRCMLETLYSTAIRRAELAHLNIGDIDFGREVVLIREGKGRKDRYVPIGSRALEWICRYLADARPCNVVPPDNGDLFLTRFGRAFVPNGVSELVSGAVRKSGVDKHGSTHLFRHTVATLMLEGGADIRHIQLMLGHESLATTQIYTRVSIKSLKRAHSATHPGAGVDPPENYELRILLDESVDPDD